MKFIMFLRMPGGELVSADLRSEIGREMVLGQALNGRRQQVVIATKFGHIVNEDKKVVYGDEKQILKN